MTDQSHSLTEARYVSFAGMRCEERAEAVVDLVLAACGDARWTNAFWDLFRVKVAAARAADPQPGTPDVLYLVCSHVFYIDDLFEETDNAEGLALLRAIEHDCC